LYWFVLGVCEAYEVEGGSEGGLVKIERREVEWIRERFRGKE
jgi:hypothetical protein